MPIFSDLLNIQNSPFNLFILFSDVCVGSLIGFLVSYLCYRQYYPRLSSSLCHLPYLLLPIVQQRSNLYNSGTPSEDIPVFSNGRSSPNFQYYDDRTPMEEQIKLI